MMTTTAQANTGSRQARTIDEILCKIAQAERSMRAMRDEVDSFTNVLVKKLCTQRVPVRVHKKRRNQTAAYHARVQKKWTKRFGTKEAPAAFLIDNRYLGGRGRTLVAHPSLMEKANAA